MPYGVRLADNVSYRLRLDAEARQELADLGREIEYPAREVVIRQEEPSTHVLLVCSGWLKITAVARNGHEALLRLRGPGDLVGESAVLLNAHRAATVTAVHDVRALSITASVFTRFLGDRPAAMKQLLALTMDRQRTADQMRVENATCPAKKRAARVLIELAEHVGERTDRGVEICIPLTQQELAGAVGSSRETVTRALGELRGEGVIERHGRTYTLVRLEKLRQIAV